LSAVAYTGPPPSKTSKPGIPLQSRDVRGSIPRWLLHRAKTLHNLLIGFSGCSGIDLLLWVRDLSILQIM